MRTWDLWKYTPECITAPVRRWQALQWQTFTIVGSPLTVARSDPQWQQAVRSIWPSQHNDLLSRIQGGGAVGWFAYT